MPRKAKTEVTPEIKGAVPEVKNGGKVETKEGEAIEMKNAIELDTSPTIPNIPKAEAEQKNTKKVKEETKPILDTELAVCPASSDLPTLQAKMTKLGCILADKLTGVDEKLNGESLSEKQVASVQALIDLYYALSRKD